MKKVLLMIVAVIMIGGCVKILSALDNYEYTKATERCHGKQNVILKHTNQGDRYYVCK